MITFEQLESLWGHAPCFIRWALGYETRDGYDNTKAKGPEKYPEVTKATARAVMFLLEKKLFVQYTWCPWYCTDLRGSDFRRFRESKGLSTSEMAYLLGVSRHGNYLKTERGNNPGRTRATLSALKFMSGKGVFEEYLEGVQ